MSHVSLIVLVILLANGSAFSSVDTGDSGHSLVMGAAQAAYQIGGRLVRAGTRAPLEGRILVSQVLSDGSMKVGSIKVGRDGDFVTSDIEGGPVVLVGYAENHGRSVSIVELAEGIPSEIEIALPLAAVVEGMIIDNYGNPLVGAAIRVEYLAPLALDLTSGLSDEIAIPEGNWHRGTGRTRNEPEPGAFRIRDVDPHRAFRIVVLHEAIGRSAASDALMLGSGETRAGLRIVMDVRDD